MLAGPVFRLELLTIGRRTRYFITRVAYGLGLLIALWLCYLEAFPYYQRAQGVSFNLSDYSRLALYFFASFAGIQLGLILLVTPAMTAGTIAVEHERRTIDYLLTTELTDTEITLSKFLARLAAIILQLLVGLPVMLIVMLFGGIRTETIVQVFGYSLCVLVATASLSLWISASTRNSRAAITSAYLVVIALGAIPPAAAVMLHEGFGFRSGWVSDAASAVIAWNPAAMIVFAFEDPPRDFIPWYRPLYILPIYLGSAAVWLVLAVRAVRRTYLRASGVGAAGRDWSARLRFRRRPVGSHAMLWKELVSQQRALRLGWIGRVAALLLFGAAYCGLGFAIWQTSEEERTARNNHFSYGYVKPDPLGYRMPFHRASLHEFTVGAEMLAGSFVLLLVTARAAGSITVEREQDSWLTLISTPVEGRSIAMAKISGAIYSVRYWYLFLLVAWTCCAIRYPPFAFVAPLLFLSHLMFAWLCAATGVFFSARCKTSLWAIGSALSTVVLVGGGLPLLCLAIAAIGSRTPDPPMAAGFIIPATLGFIDIGMIEEMVRIRNLRHEIEMYHSAIVAHVVYAALAVFVTFIVDATFDAACGRMTTRFNYDGTGLGFDSPDIPTAGSPPDDLPPGSPFPEPGPDSVEPRPPTGGTLPIAPST
jgi:ABC-type transport system involved in multi-copper enzyme maturation permease subunit